MKSAVLSGKAILWCLCCLLACVVQPAPSRGGFFDFSIQEEKELGQEFKVLISSQFPVIHDQEINRYFHKLLHDISSVMPARLFPLSITVIRDKSLNAFAAPAGQLFVHSGLILAMEDEAELAGVIAHELAHVSQRHLAQRIEQSKIISIGTAVGVLAGALLSGSGELGRAVAVGSIAGGQAAALKYTREDEREADQIGLNYLQKSGHDPFGLLKSFKRIQKHKLLGGVSAPLPYMLTHPGLVERIGYLQDRLAGVSWDQGRQPDQAGSFLKIQTLLRAKHTDPAMAVTHYQRLGEDRSCLDTLGLAIALERQNKVGEAEGFFQQSKECGQNRFLVNREFGRFYFLTGKYEAGLSYLERALAENPDDSVSLYYQARIFKEFKRFDAAVAVLQKILGAYPELAEVHSLLGQVYGRSGDRFKGFLHLAYGVLYQNKEKKTEEYLDKIQSLAKTPNQQNAVNRFVQLYEQRKKFW